MLKIGIVGLNMVGKTTLFKILTHAHGDKLAGGKPEAHVGVVKVPDERLDRLAGGDAADVERFGQPAFGGNLLASLEISRVYLFSQAGIQLDVAASPWMVP